MIGRIQYVVSLANTPAAPPATVNVPIGDLQTIDLSTGYTALTAENDDDRTLSRAASGMIEARLFFNAKLIKFEIPNVLETVDANSDYAIMMKLNNELARGTLIIWYPDFETYPAEYFSCIGKKRIDPAREGHSMRWTFKYDLLVLQSVQAVSTVPNHIYS